MDFSEIMFANLDAAARELVAKDNQTELDAICSRNGFFIENLSDEERILLIQLVLNYKRA